MLKKESNYELFVGDINAIFVFQFSENDDNEIILPLNSNYKYDFTVDWRRWNNRAYYIF